MNPRKFIAITVVTSMVLAMSPAAAFASPGQQGQYGSQNGYGSGNQGPKGKNYGSDNKGPKGKNYGSDNKGPKGKNYGSDNKGPKGKNYGNKKPYTGKKYGKYDFGKHKYPKLHKTHYPKLHKMHYPKLHKMHYPKLHKIHFPKYNPKIPHKVYCKPKSPKPSGGHHHHGGGFGDAVLWSVISCATGIVTTAIIANYRDHRELTAEEAQSCGVLFLFSTPSH